MRDIYESMSCYICYIYATHICVSRIYAFRALRHICDAYMCVTYMLLEHSAIYARI